MHTIIKEIERLLEKVRQQAPLIHNITNYVTVNDVANAVLAVGASPIMADDIGEAAEISAHCAALVLNIGTLNRRTIASMLEAGKRANSLSIPVIFDPVGAGASTLRNETTQKILEEVKISVLRGNLSEISFVAGMRSSTKGVDASNLDSKNDGVFVAQTVAKKLNCTVAVTGPVDYIADTGRVIKIANGHPMLSRVTGTGCMTTAVTGAFAGVAKTYLTAAAAGVVCMGIAGEIAFERAGASGTGSFHIAILDALSTICAEDMIKRGKIDVL